MSGMEGPGSQIDDVIASPGVPAWIEVCILFCC